MSARYLRIDALQEPYDFGVDEAGRQKLQFNVRGELARVESAPNVLAQYSFPDELAKILTDASPTFVSSGPNRNIFVGTTAKIPQGAGPYISIVTTSGLAPTKTHNRLGPSYYNPTALIVVRATDQVAAIAMAKAAYDALVVVVNQTITP